MTNLKAPNIQKKPKTYACLQTPNASCAFLKDKWTSKRAVQKPHFTSEMLPQ